VVGEGFEVVLFQHTAEMLNGPVDGQHAGVHRVLHFLTPDYSKFPPKVNTWRRKPKIGGGNKKVPVPDDTFPTSNQQDSSPTLKLVSRSVKRNQPLRGSVLKPIHDPYYTSMCRRSARRG
jgi:hypothetical protein